MTAESYYDQPGLQENARSRPQGDRHNHQHKTEGPGQEMHPEQRGYPQHGYNLQSCNGQNGGAYDEQPHHHHTGQPQMRNSTYTPGDPQEQGLVPDIRDTLTKCTDNPSRLDRFEKKFGDKRFNDPATVEKNRALNENILKRLKQIVMLVIQKGSWHIDEDVEFEIKGIHQTQGGTREIWITE